ncbi:tyrosine-type recombinase/integrase [Ursidibacter sp. B-7004-1]
MNQYPNLKPQEITDEHIIEWRNIMLQKAKPISWNNYARHLRSIYNFGIENELLIFRKNPFKVFFVREGKEKKKTYTDAELEVIDGLFDNEYWLDRYLSPRWFIAAIIKVFRYTGMRQSQLVNLKIQDIDLSRRVICISATTNKNHNYHEIPISTHLYPFLEKMVYEMKIRKRVGTDQLFNLNVVSRRTLNRKRNMSVHQLENIFRHISKIVGFRVSSHRFRHTIATKLMKNPDNLYITKQLLGHSDLKVTLSYIEYHSDMLRSCVDKL